MHDTFLSIIVPVGEGDTPQKVTHFLTSVHRDIASTFADFEVILVDNGSGIDFQSCELSEEARRNCYIVKLARQVVWDRAVLAGLERANGDYSVSFDSALADHLGVIGTMYLTAVDGSDIVYLRNQETLGAQRSFRRRLFFWALRMSGATHLHRRDRRETLVNRRALNWIVRQQRAHWYLNDAFLSSGFSVRTMEVDLPTLASPRSIAAASDQAWNTLVRSPRFLTLVARGVIGSLLAILGIVVVNALLVRVINRDILWQVQPAVPGWTYIVVLLAGGFAGLALLLYVILRVQLILLEEVQSQPRYVIEHFGRV